ncbi:Pentatricopeptide repeat-containing protein [Frankliniella fusca]|uniref:Pentatricopeptide repeat-containing protein n=1 Tax=Frankliniella fusca TaxID=407009 RepID=A0AAE1HJG3_9NEOP|nr:Pentatricopeptide repeat-containing protein [Frankliniella fusca]
MDLAEMMKTIMAKEAGMNAGVSSSVTASGVNPAILAGASTSISGSSSSGQATTTGTPFGTSYITEKLYTVLQMYLQHKGWNSVELLQCFAEMKEAAMIPNAAAYLQMMASRVTLDSQGRLVHRENGKLILPFEHFANAVMLKHMNRPHSMHLNVEATVRAVMESYTIGRDYFGMEKEFIYEVVQNCPECRYYKSQMPSYHPIPDNNDKSSKGLKDLLPVSQRQHQDYKSSTRGKFNPSSTTVSNFTKVLQFNLYNLNLQYELNLGQLPQSLADAANMLRASTGTPAPYSKSSSSTEFSQSNISNKDLLALHNGAWSSHEDQGSYKRSNVEGGQEKIVRAFAEVMRNLHRMKMCIRPSMCKPYGKQSEMLQKTLEDTLLLVQAMRSFLPPPQY